MEKIEDSPSLEIANPRVANWEKKTEKFTLLLSLIFLAVLVVPLAHPISTNTENLFKNINLVIWAIFAADYLFKFSISTKKLDFLKSHMFELLVVAIPAFRSLRILRLFPLIGYFLKYTQKSLSGRLLQYVSLAAVLVTFPSAVAMYQLEKDIEGSNIKTLGDALWWAITTATTVGYGDKFPVSAGGRALSILVMVVGISLVGVITASVASWFVKADESKSDQEQLAELKSELQEIRAELRNLRS